jgi:hypothetical protein
MRVSSFEKVQRLSGILRICLCLAVVGIFVLATDNSSAATTSGGAPDIRSFTGDPLTVKDGDSVLYSFEVWNATSLQIAESGEIIKQITSAPSLTLKGKERGRTAFQIRTGNMSSFDTILTAANSAGKKMMRVTIKFATAPTVKSLSTTSGQTGATDNKSRSPQWLPQLGSAGPLTSTGATTPGEQPNFYKCTDKCNNCLKPDEAAGRGYTDRCSDQPCYYSPDHQQKWYCYSKPVTVWCCSDGKVVETTKEACARAGGTYYATEAEANKACQAMMGWFCRNGTVYQGTRTQAAQAGVDWYTSQAEAARACNPAGWCCKDGKVGQTTQSQCSQLGGYWFDTQGEALRACQQATMGWFCYSGQVYQGTQAQAAQMGVTWYTSQSQAASQCQQQPTSCWCCSGGKVSQMSTAACTRYGGNCYPDQKSATAACYRITPPTLK